MKYSESLDNIQLALKHDYLLWVTVDDGTFEVSAEDALEAWNNLAPGEWFEAVIAE